MRCLRLASLLPSYTAHSGSKSTSIEYVQESAKQCTLWRLSKVSTDKMTHSYGAWSFNLSENSIEWMTSGWVSVMYGLIAYNSQDETDGLEYSELIISIIFI